MAKAEFALAAAEDDVLSALDTAQREALYGLLALATTEPGLDCAADEPAAC